VARTGVPEVHLRAAAEVASRSRYRNPNLPYDAGTRATTSPEMVRAVVALLRGSAKPHSRPIP
jgi:hypothetical protein